MGEGYMVPRHVFDYGVGRDSGGIETHLYGAGGLVDHGDEVVEPLFVKHVQDFMSQSIVPDRADHPAFISETAGMVGEIGRGASYGLA